MFNNIIRIVYYCYFRPIIKWILYRLTRLHELQRICYGAPEGMSRTSKVEKSLELSRTSDIRALILNFNQLILNSYDDHYMKIQIVDVAVQTILKAKKINPKIHQDFPRLFGSCVCQIYGYRRLYHIVEEMRTTQYDCENLEHETKLLELWKLLMPNVHLVGRISKQWQEIGFQVMDLIIL